MDYSSQVPPDTKSLFLLFVCLQGHDCSELLRLEICQKIRRNWILCFPSIYDLHLPATHKPQHGEARTHTHTGGITDGYYCRGCVLLSVCLSHLIVQPGELYKGNPADGAANANDADAGENLIVVLSLF